MKMNKIITIALMVFSVMGIQTAEAQSSSPSTKWHWDKGTIVVENSRASCRAGNQYWD